MADADEEAEGLRRVAYGPGTSATERAEAEAALRALAERRADAGDASEVVSDVEVLASLERGGVESNVAHGGDGEEIAAPTPIWERRIRVAWVVPMVVVAVVVGALGALQATGQFGPTSQVERPATSSPTDPPPKAWIQTPGDLEAADAWFDRPATASDAYPFQGLLDSNDIDPYEVRFVLTDGIEWNVWVGRSRSGGLCLLVTDRRDSTGTGRCVVRDEFAQAGALVASGGHFAYWTGDTVSTDRSSAGHSGLTSPSAGPGNEKAAQAWFAEPATPSDLFPYPDALTGLGIDPSDVRSVGNNDPGWALWLSRQGAAGYCLMATTNLADAMFSSCVTVEVFRTSGVSLVAQGHSAFWNGESVTSSG